MHTISSKWGLESLSIFTWLFHFSHPTSVFCSNCLSRPGIRSVRVLERTPAHKFISRGAKNTQISWVWRSSPALKANNFLIPWFSSFSKCCWCGDNSSSKNYEKKKVSIRRARPKQSTSVRTFTASVPSFERAWF